MKKSNESTLGEVIKDLLKSYKLDVRLKEHQVTDIWEKVMGKMIARNTKDVYVRNGVLFIRLESSIIKNELNYAKDKILKNVNSELGEDVVNKIVFL
ncbi:MAG: DUF721 domain-containing protein [Bacteroidales bacterium]